MNIFFKTLSHIYFHTLAYFISGMGQILLIYSPNFVALVVIYGAFGVGEGLYYGCLTSIACQVAGSANLSNQAIGYYHTFIAFSLNIGMSNHLKLVYNKVTELRVQSCLDEILVNVISHLKVGLLKNRKQALLVMQMPCRNYHFQSQISVKSN